MLKMKHLFDNRDLAIMILKNWNYDESHLDVLDHFRISANAIYPFKHDGEIFFLRFAPSEDKNLNNILAELEFIQYLNSHGLNRLECVASIDGHSIKHVVTPWGEYYASVFRRVNGDSLEDIKVNEQLMKKYGESLGRLHELSSEFQPKRHQRWMFDDVLDWISLELYKFKHEEDAIICLQNLREKLSQTPQDFNCFGLIHFDYQMDNVLYDSELDQMNIIDFDDAMYGWYVMDIANALKSIESETPADKHELYKKSFLEGYREAFEINDDMLLMMPIFSQFDELYRYTRILVSLKETWNHEPDWMMLLREKLTRRLESQREQMRHGLCI